MSWVVAGAAAVVKVAGESRYLDRGAAVPVEADPDSIAHLVAVGLIVETGEAKPEPVVKPRAKR